MFDLNGLLKMLSVFWLGGTWATVVIVGWVLRPVAASWAQRQGKL